MYGLPRFSFTAFGAFTIAYVGLPLLGWGIRDLPGFLDQPARILYLVSAAAFAFLSAVFTQDVPGSKGRRGQESKRLKRHTIVLEFVRITHCLTLFAAPYCDRRDIATAFEADGVRYAGLAPLILGVTLAVWAAAVLGRQFSEHVTIQDNHQLITTGPFRVLRHPRYLGAILYTLGIAIVFRSWVGYAGWLVYVVFILYRIPAEERLLAGEFGDDWDQYTEKTWRLIPFVF